MPRIAHWRLIAGIIVAVVPVLCASFLSLTPLLVVSWLAALGLIALTADYVRITRRLALGSRDRLRENTERHGHHDDSFERLLASHDLMDGAIAGNRRLLDEVATDVAHLRASAESERVNLGAVAGGVAEVRLLLDQQRQDHEAAAEAHFDLRAQVEQERANLGAIAGGLDDLRTAHSVTNTEMRETIARESANLGAVAGGLDSLRRTTAGVELIQSQHALFTDSLMDVARRLDSMTVRVYAVEDAQRDTGDGRDDGQWEALRLEHSALVVEQAALTASLEQLTDRQARSETSLGEVAVSLDRLVEAHLSSATVAGDMQAAQERLAGAQARTDDSIRDLSFSLERAASGQEELKLSIAELNTSHQPLTVECANLAERLATIDGQLLSIGDMAGRLEASETRTGEAFRGVAETRQRIERVTQFIDRINKEIDTLAGFGRRFEDVARAAFSTERRVETIMQDPALIPSSERERSHGGIAGNADEVTHVIGRIDALGSALTGLNNGVNGQLALLRDQVGAQSASLELFLRQVPDGAAGLSSKGPTASPALS